MVNKYEKPSVTYRDRGLDSNVCKCDYNRALAAEYTSNQATLVPPSNVGFEAFAFDSRRAEILY